MVSTTYKVQQQPIVTAQPLAVGNLSPAYQTTTHQNVNSNNIVINSGGSGGDGNSLLLVPKDKLMSRSWTTGICGCMSNCGNCLCGLFFLPCLMCRVANRMNECALISYIPGGFVSLRTKLRTMGGIKGSICSDFLVTSFCSPCALCQMSREMDNMGL